MINMMLQETIGLDVSAYVTVFFMVFMIVLMLYMYNKHRIWYVSLLILIFSIFVWTQALSVDLPLAPVFQNFFMLFQVLMFVAFSIKAWRK